MTGQPEEGYPKEKIINLTFKVLKGYKRPRMFYRI
jgi:hypothetical protein